MEIEEIIGELIIGVFLLFTAFQIGCKGNIQLIHSYHYTNLDPKDLKIYTKKMGIGSAVVGAGVFLIPVINLISHSDAGYYVGFISVIAGTLYLIMVIVKYNGTLISFRRK